METGITGFIQNHKSLFGYLVIGIIVVILIVTRSHHTVINQNQPVVSEHSGWNIGTNAEQGLVFSYPETLGTTYIHPVDASWPPLIGASSKPFNCSLGGSDISKSGSTHQVIVENRTYCVKKTAEGAAGSTYTTYNYTTPYDNGRTSNEVVTISFVLQAPQCDNYDEPQKSACKTEQGTFDITNIIDQIFKTIKED